MKLIKNNPYRTVGLLAGATAREQERQIRRLKQYIEAEQETQNDFSFPVLGRIHRTIDSVSEAASKLNLDHDKMNAALFWFYSGYPITDEPAFDALKDADLNSATAIWSKLIASGEVTQRNSSAFQNLSTLLLCTSFNGSTINPSLFEQGIRLKLKFLDSDLVKELKESATDVTFQATKKEIQLVFLKGILEELDRNGGISSNKLLEILSKQDFSAKEDFLKSLIQKPIEQIEKKIEATKIKRKANKANAANAGNLLYDETAADLQQLNAIVGISNLKFSTVSDKVSDEILQCGIDYFLHYRDSNTDPGSVSMDLFKKAKIFAIGNIAKQRCQENTESLKEWIDEKPEREKQKKIINDLERLKNLLDEYERKSETVFNAKQLLVSARPYLNNIKAILGSTDDLYLGLSSRIASDAQNMCVSEINKLQEKISLTFDNASKLATILLLKEKVDEAWDVQNTIGSMDLRNDFRARHNTNRSSLSNLKSQLAQIRSSSSSGGGCYVATMAYGDYNHPKVMALRQFRDNVLAKSALGRHFIMTYYFISPKLVEVLKNQKAINELIRKALNQIIKLIEK